MVTVAIAEEKGIISRMFQKMNLSKTAKAFPNSDCHYRFISPESQNTCDILLLQSPTPFPAARASFATLINADREIPPPKEKNSLLVTYGLNSLATVTASSIQPEQTSIHFQCCLQRSIVTISGELLEPQEFPVFLPFFWEDAGIALGFVTLGLLLSLPPEMFRSPRF